MVNVFLTIDTEISSPIGADWRESGLEKEIRRDVYGATPEGEFGLRFQLDLLNAHGLKANVFLDTLFAREVGMQPLRRIVETVRSRGHQVQLHLHTEWLERIRSPLLPGRNGRNLGDFTEDEQTILIACGVEYLQACDAGPVCAFRAGNWGANFDTLRALARNRIGYDSSYNACYLGAPCGLQTREPLFQPRLLEGVHEFPLSFFHCFPGQLRPLQLCACASGEIESALWRAAERGWFSFVVVLHSFELLRRSKRPGHVNRPCRICLKRLERLCRFLADHSGEFRSVFFSEIRPSEIPVNLNGGPLRARAGQTIWRYAEQLAARIL